MTRNTDSGSYLYDVIVKQQPEVVTLDDSDVMSAIRAAVDTTQTKSYITIF